MKKIITVLLCISICVFLSACSDNNAVIEETVSESVSSTVQTQKPSGTATNESPAADASDSSASVKENSTAKLQDTTTADSKASGTTSVITTSKAAATSSTAATKQTTSTTTTQTITCTVMIEYKSILDNMDKLKAGHEAYISSSGVLLDTCTLNVKSGTTAYEALRQACSNNGITISTSGSAQSIYIVGFNNIDEKDCGAGSGWLYFINSSSPSKSCSKYILQNGDSIVFSYTC